MGSLPVARRLCAWARHCFGVVKNVSGTGTYIMLPLRKALVRFLKLGVSRH